MGGQVSAVVSIILGLLAFASLGGVLYSAAKGAANEATIKRLREENVDYLGRLNYIEPRMKAAEQQNETLIRLIDPHPALKEIGEKVDKVEEKTESLVTLFRQHQRTLSEVARAVRVKPKDDGY